MNIVATQSISSPLVEVSWSYPSNGFNILTGYRIFYGNEESMLLPSYVTRIVLDFNDSQAGTEVSMRSESMIALPSELITVEITSDNGKLNHNNIIMTIFS